MRRSTLQSIIGQMFDGATPSVMRCYYKGEFVGEVKICQGSTQPIRQWYARQAGIKKFDRFTIDDRIDTDKMRVPGLHETMAYYNRHDNFVRRRDGIYWQIKSAKNMFPTPGVGPTMKDFEDMMTILHRKTVERT